MLNYVWLYIFQEDLKRALLASLEDSSRAGGDGSVGGGGSGWIKDASGRHANITALLDWPEEDDADPESLHLTPGGKRETVF